MASGIDQTSVSETHRCTGRLITLAACLTATGQRSDTVPSAYTGYPGNVIGDNAPRIRPHACWALHNLIAREQALLHHSHQVLVIYVPGAGHHIRSDGTQLRGVLTVAAGVCTPSFVESFLKMCDDHIDLLFTEIQFRNRDYIISRLNWVPIFTPPNLPV